MVLPLGEGACEFAARELVALGEFRYERTDGAASPRVQAHLVSDEGVEPGGDAGPGNIW